jgi:hypothetical protein
MGCPGCLLDAKEQSQRWDQTLRKAKEYAIENNVMVVVYKDETGESHFIEADKARSIGINGQFVSPLRPNTDGHIP